MAVIQRLLEYTYPWLQQIGNLFQGEKEGISNTSKK